MCTNSSALAFPRREANESDATKTRQKQKRDRWRGEVDISPPPKKKLRLYESHNPQRIDPRLSPGEPHSHNSCLTRYLAPASPGDSIRKHDLSGVPSSLIITSIITSIATHHSLPALCAMWGSGGSNPPSSSLPPEGGRGAYHP